MLREVLRPTRGTQEWEHYINGIIEVLFERERTRLRKTPARFKSIHVFRTLDAARRFRLEWRPGARGIYSVEWDGDMRHDGFMEWTNATNINPDGDLDAQLDAIADNGRRYWRGERPPGEERPDVYAETLLSPHVRVTGVVEQFLST